MAKDFYKILGLTDAEKQLKGNDFLKVAKEKYRNLCKKWHPDKFASKSEKEKNDAENIMKDINEAYETLSDEKKRAEYDNPNTFGGFNGFNPFGGAEDFNPFGGFSSFFKNGGNSQRNIKGDNIRVTLKVNLEDLFTKKEKTIRYTRMEGNGNTCHVCGGSGMQVSQKNGIIFRTTCRHCGGTGFESKEATHECSFTLNGIDDTYDVNFDPNTNILKFVKVIEGEGNTVSSNKSQNGDLIVVVNTVLPKGYTLETAIDVTKEIEIPLLTALLGGEQEVETLQGIKLNAKIPNGVTEGTKIRFSGKGLQSNGTFGNMIGIITIRMPKTLTDKEKEILSQLKESPNFK